LRRGLRLLNVRLRERCDLAQRISYAVDAQILLRAGLRNLRDNTVHLAGISSDFLEDRADASRNLSSLPALDHGCFNQGRSLLGRLRATLRQSSYFIGDHGESEPSLACPGRLNGRIQSQDAGLK